MENLLSNPAFQSGILPFIVAFVALAILRHWGKIGVGLSFAIAYLSSVYFTTGIQIFPLSSTRKLLVIALAALLVGLVLDKTQIKKSHILPTTAGLFALAILWVIWPVLNTLSGMSLGLAPIAALGYVAWLSSSMQQLPKSNSLTVIALCTLGFGTGISALLGASALLGQLGITVGASLGALILWQLIQRNLSTGLGLKFGASWLVGSIGIAAVAYARLPWYSLVPLALLPLIYQLPPVSRLVTAQNRYLAEAISLTIGFTFAGCAAFITWQSAGDPLY